MPLLDIDACGAICLLEVVVLVITEFSLSSLQVCSLFLVWCSILQAGALRRWLTIVVRMRRHTKWACVLWAGPSTQPLEALCSLSSVPCFQPRLRSPPPATRCRMRLKRDGVSFVCCEMRAQTTQMKENYLCPTFTVWNDCCINGNVVQTYCWSADQTLYTCICFCFVLSRSNAVLPSQNICITDYS